MGTVFYFPRWLFEITKQYYGSFKKEIIILNVAGVKVRNALSHLPDQRKWFIAMQWQKKTGVVGITAPSDVDRIFPLRDWSFFDHRDIITFGTVK